MRKYTRASRSGGWNGRACSLRPIRRSKPARSKAPLSHGPIDIWDARKIILLPPRSRYERSLTLSRALSLTYGPGSGSLLRSWISWSHKEGPPTQPILSEVSANWAIDAEGNATRRERGGNCRGGKPASSIPSTLLRTLRARTPVLAWLLLISYATWPILLPQIFYLSLFLAPFQWFHL